MIVPTATGLFARRCLLLLLVSGCMALTPGSGSASTERDERALGRIGRVPAGLPPVPIPEDNPVTPQKIELGRKLFFDRRLSVNNTMSCGMCHIPEQGFTNNELATPVGVEGRTVRRNSPTILNAAYVKQVFHDGRAESLEEQALAPLVAHNEMANPSVDYVVDKIRGLADYKGKFESAFGGGPTQERLGQALAAWERTIIAGDSPFDRWKYGGDENALTEEQKNGFEIFAGRGRCVVCHPIDQNYALFTDDQFHDTGIGYFGGEVAAREATPIPVEIAPDVVIPVDRGFMATISEQTEADFGRYEVTDNPADMWRFKTPSLRNVSVTAPYMHDGSLRTLEDVVRFYVRGGIAHPGLDPVIQPLDLTDREIRALVSFLESLTSPDIGVLVEDARSAPIGN